MNILLLSFKAIVLLLIALKFDCKSTRFQMHIAMMQNKYCNFITNSFLQDRIVENSKTLKLFLYFCNKNTQSCFWLKDFFNSTPSLFSRFSTNTK